MPAVKIPLTSLVEGVSTRPMPYRVPGTLAEAVNASMRRARGCEKRPGTVLVKTDQADYSLDITNPGNPKFYHFIDRSEFEKFLIVIDPLNTGAARIECFTLVRRGNGDGSTGNEKAGQKLTLNSVLSGSDDPLDYIGAAGTTVARHRFRALTVTDTTIIANRDVSVGLAGTAITYQTAAGNPIRVVSENNVNNLASWNDFPQPPTGTASAGATTSDYIFYARDDDLGWPAGWYRAVSTTVPPWYERIRTEPADSLIDHTKWPVQLQFDGTKFNLSFPAWNPRYSGDSFTNPGPQLASGPSAPHKIRDLCFFQSRLWFGGYEFIDSSALGDVFNLWNNSYVGITDADPINVSLQSDAVTTVDWMVPFDGGVVCLTRGARQFELRSQGAMTPSTVSVLPATSLKTVDYCPPVKLGNQLYFVGELNGANVIHEYMFQADRASNVATTATAEVEGYIPARLWTLKASSLNDMLFGLSTTLVDTIFVCQMQWNEGRNEQRAWMKWERDGTPIHAIHAIDSKLYIVVQRNQGGGPKLYLETLDIDLPSNDDSGETPTTVNGYSGSGDMGFAIRLDCRGTYQGVYDPATDETTWTLPFREPGINRVVLGQMFDCDYEFPPGTFNQQRRKGEVLKPISEGGNLTISTTSTTTTVKAPGNYATNANGNNALCWIGINYEQRLTLNEQFVRDEQGVTIPGRVQLKHLTLKLVDTHYLRVEITPEGRDTISFEYINDTVGQTIPSKGTDAVPYEEFNLPCLGKAHDLTIEIVNDSVYPSRIVGGQFNATIVVERRDPTEK